MTTYPPRVVGVVPAYNEATRIAATVQALLDAGVCGRVLVVDDGSADETSRMARSAGASVVRLEKNSGKGRAVAIGLDNVEPCDIVLLADADLGASAAALSALVEEVERGADLAIASFTAPGGFGLAKKMAAWGIRALTGTTMNSPLSGQRALAKRALEGLLPFPGGWGMEVAMTVKALWLGLSVVEVPLPLKHRSTGRDLPGFVHRGRQCLAVAAAIARLAGQRKPKRRMQRS